MARQAVRDAIQATLGKYVYDLDVDKLSLSFWEGRIEFPRNLKLNAEAINRAIQYDFSDVDDTENDAIHTWEHPWLCDDWDLNVNYGHRKKSDFSGNCWNILKNVHVISGSIKKIQIDVPWASLASRAVTVKISGVRLVLAPLPKNNPIPPPIVPRRFSMGGLSHSSPSLEDDNTSKVSSWGETASIFTRGSQRTSIASKKKSAFFNKKIMSSIPYSAQLGNERLRHKHKREESLIVKKRRQIINKAYTDRKTNQTLQEALFSTNETSTNKKKPLTRRGTIDSNAFQVKHNLETYRNTYSSTPNVRRISSSCSKEEDKRASFRQRLMRRVLENLQLDVTGVHLQYKRDTNNVQPSTTNDVKFSSGIVIDSLSYDTTDEHGRRAFVDRASYGAGEDFLFKALRISGLGVYLDDGTDTVDEEDDQESIRTGSRTEEKSHTSSSSMRRNFVVLPLSFEAAYHQSDNAHSSADYPKYLLFSQLPHVSVSLSRTQVELVQTIIHTLISNGPRPKFPEYRPACSITSSTAKLWWKYAFRCIGRLNRRSSWVEFFKAFRLRKRYIELYKRKRYNTIYNWLEPLSTTESAELQKIEDNRTISIDGILQWRFLAENRMIAEKLQKISDRKIDSSKEKDAKKSNAFNLGKIFKNTYHAREDSDPNMHDNASFALSAEEIHELEAQLEYLQDSTLPDQSKLVEIEVTLGSLTVNLQESNTSRPIAKLQMGTMEGNFNCTAGGATKLSFALMSLNVDDHRTLQPIFPSVFRSIHTEAELDESGHESITHAITFTIEKSKHGERKAALNVIAFEIVVSFSFYYKLTSFFALSSGHEEMNISVSKFYDNFISSVSSNISRTLEKAWREKQHKKLKWKVECEIDAPVLIFPENDDDPNSSVIIFDMGKHRISSSNVNLEKVKEHYSSELETFTTASLDCWFIEIANAQCLLGKANNNDWIMIKTEDDDDLSGMVSKRVIEPFSLALDLGFYSEKDERSNVYIDCNLPSIIFSLSKNNLSKINQVISNFSTGWNRDLFILPSQEPSSDNPESPHSFFFDGCLLEREVKTFNTCFYYSITCKKVSVRIQMELEKMLELQILHIKTSTMVDYDGFSHSNLSLGRLWCIERSNLCAKLLIYSLISSPQNSSSIDEILSSTHTLNDLKQLKQEPVDGLVLDATVSVSDPSTSMESLTSDLFVQKPKQINLTFTIKNLFLNWHRSTVECMLSIVENMKPTMTPQIDNIHVATSEICQIREDDGTLSSASMIGEAPSSKNLLFGILCPIVLATRELALNEMSTIPIRFRINSTSLKISLFNNEDNKEFLLLYAAETVFTHQKLCDGSRDRMIAIKDLRVQNPCYGKILPFYENILHFSPDSDVGPVLELKFSKCLMPSQSGSTKQQYFITGKIPPLRFVYMNGQINSLINHLKENIPEYILDKTLSTLSSFRNELKDPLSGEQYFELKASELEIVVPRNSESSDSFKIFVDDANARYNATDPYAGVGTGSVALHGISIKCNKDFPVLTDPINIIVDVNAHPPPFDIDAQSSVTIISRLTPIAIALTKDQYIQAIDTFEKNIFAKHTFVERASKISKSNDTDDEDSISSLSSIGEDDNVTHKRKTDQDDNSWKKRWITRKTNATLKMSTISIKFHCSDIEKDSMVGFRLEAIHCAFKADPKENVSNVEATLGSFVIDYLKENTSNFHRFLGRTPTTKEESPFVMVMHLSQHSDGSIDLSWVTNDLQLLFSPEPFAHVLYFLDSGRPPRLYHDETLSSVRKTSSHPIKRAESKDSLKDSQTVINYSFELVNCRLVLFEKEALRPPTNHCTVQVPSAVVFQSRVNVQLVHSKSNNKDVTVTFTCEDTEIYKAEGVELTNPIQILQPMGFSLIAYMSSLATKSSIEVKLVFLSTTCIAISIQDIALLTNTLSSINIWYLIELSYILNNKPPPIKNIASKPKYEQSRPTENVNCVPNNELRVKQLNQSECNGNHIRVTAHHKPDENNDASGALAEGSDMKKEESRQIGKKKGVDHSKQVETGAVNEIKKPKEARPIGLSNFLGSMFSKRGISNVTSNGGTSSDKNEEIFDEHGCDTITSVTEKESSDKFDSRKNLTLDENKSNSCDVEDHGNIKKPNKVTKKETFEENNEKCVQSAISTEENQIIQVDGNKNTGGINDICCYSREEYYETRFHWLKLYGLIYHLKSYVKDNTTSIRVSTTLPDANLVFINDVNGNDQPLFKVVFETVVIGGEGQTRFLTSSKISIPDTTFDFHTRLTVLSELYNSLSHRWEPLLATPWFSSLSLVRKHDTHNSEDEKRLTTLFYFNSESCSLSLPDHFIINLRSVWKMWSGFNRSYFANFIGLYDGNQVDSNKRKHVYTSLGLPNPYAINNLLGIDIHYGVGENEPTNICPKGTITYFRTETPIINGTGGKRLYGQDLLKFNAISVQVGQDTSNVISLPHLDNENSTRYHKLADGSGVFTDILRTEKNLILCVKPHVLVYNFTCLSYDLSMKYQDEISDIGHLAALSAATETSSISKSISELDHTYIQCIGIPGQQIVKFYKASREKYHTVSSPTLMFSIKGSILGFNENDFTGGIDLPSFGEVKKAANNESPVIPVDLTMKTSDAIEELHIRVNIWAKLISGEVQLSIFVQPKALIHNSLPVSVIVCTHSLHTFSIMNRYGYKVDVKNPEKRIHRLNEHQELQIFSSTSSIALSVKYADTSVAGGITGWIQRDWVHIPLERNDRIDKQIKCLFSCLDNTSLASEFTLLEVDFKKCVHQESTDKNDNSKTVTFPFVFKPREHIKTFSLISQNAGVDHTNALLFQTVRFDRNTVKDINDISKASFGAFQQKETSSRVSILPDADTQIRLVEDDRKSNSNRRSLPFRVKDISVGAGGFDSTAIRWEDHSSSGYFAYQKLGNSLTTSSEIHIIPEYQILNMSGYSLLISHSDPSDDKDSLTLDTFKKVPIRKNQSSGLNVSFKIIELNYEAGPIQLDVFGVQTCSLKSSNGLACGTVIVESKVGTESERILVILGPITTYSDADERMIFHNKSLVNIWKDDFMKLQVHVDSFQLTLTDASNLTKPPIDVALFRLEDASFIFERSFVSKKDDWTENNRFVWGYALSSNERLRVLVKVKDIKFKDCDPTAEYPYMLSCSPSSSNFLDFSMYFRGSESDNALKVDSITFNIAQVDDIQSKIELNGREDLLLGMIDTIDRIMKPIHIDNKANMLLRTAKGSESKPIFEFQEVHISPLILGLNFQTQSSGSLRRHGGGHGAIFLNHLLQQMDIKEIREDFTFAKFTTLKIDSRPASVLEMIYAIYMSRLRFKWGTVIDYSGDRNEYSLLHGKSFEEICKEKKSDEVDFMEMDFLFSDLSSFISSGSRCNTSEDAEWQPLKEYVDAFGDLKILLDSSDDDSDNDDSGGENDTAEISAQNKMANFIQNRFFTKQ